MQSYTPPLGTGSTKDYDRAIRLWTREKRWRAAMLAALCGARLLARPTVADSSGHAALRAESGSTSR